MKRALILSLVVLSAANAWAADVRALYYALDDDAVVRAVETATSPSPFERALYIAALSRLGAKGRALVEAEKLRDAHPNDAWSWYAIATADYLEALPASEKMLALAGNAPDEEMVALRTWILGEVGKHDEALALLDRHPATPHLLVARGRVLGRSDPRLFAAFGEALKLDEKNVEALFWTGAFRDMERKSEEALPFFERAAALTTATRVHEEYWRTLRTLKRDVAPAIEAALAGAFRPTMTHAAANFYRAMGDTAKATRLEERVLAEAPSSIAAQMVLRDRVHRAMDAGGDALAASRAFVAWPQHHDTSLRAGAHYMLFLALWNNPSAPSEELLTAIRGMLDPRSPSRFAAAAVKLADRKLALDEAERLAREGMAAAERQLDAMRRRGMPQPQIERAAARSLAPMHDALGWVLLQRGRKSEAGKELQAAWNLDPKSMLTAYHLGRFHEAQRQLAKAESMYRAGLELGVSEKNPSLDALKALQRRRFGSPEGFESALTKARTLETESRRKEILAVRVGKSLPAFSLKTLDGRVMSNKDLEGRIAVVNFWGLWCVPCVAEMPQLQQFAAKYAKDDKVMFVTINTGDDEDRVRKWMAEKKYTFPVLVDRRWVRKHVNAFPTTWFVDRSGRIEFEARGAPDKLVEEFTWRIEALR